MQQFQEVRDCLRHHFSVVDRPQNSALFMNLLERFQLDWGDQATEEAGSNMTEYLWDMLRRSNPFAVKGTKINVNRFMSSVRTGRDLDTSWTANYYGYLVCCLEKHLLIGARFRKLSLRGDMSHRDTNSAKKSAEEVALLRSQQNQMVVATMVFGELKAQKTQRMITRVLLPLLRWQESQAHFLRSVEDSKRWLREQLVHDFFDCLSDVVGSLSREHDCRSIGLTCPRVIVSIAPKVLPEELIEDDDDVAATMGDLCMAAIAARLSRRRVCSGASLAGRSCGWSPAASSRSLPCSSSTSTTSRRRRSWSGMATPGCRP